MGQKAVKAYHDWNADRIVAEDNFGGAIIADLIHLIEPGVPYKAVHASRGKIVRAEPVAALYERGKVHHVGLHAKLEDELCTYTPQEPKSPGRMDALVWALTDLMLDAPWMSTTATYDSPTHAEEGPSESERAMQSRVDEICS
jgi:phage terminase large subunit-like protein